MKEIKRAFIEREVKRHFLFLSSSEQLFDELKRHLGLHHELQGVALQTFVDGDPNGVAHVE